LLTHDVWWGHQPRTYIDYQTFRLRRSPTLILRFGFSEAL
jgi:hypothetical protein